MWNRRNALLGGDPHLLVEILRCDVSTIGPHQGVEFGMNLEVAEVLHVVQRLEDWTAESGRQIDFAGGAISKAKPDGMAGNP
jgi:hypothetical protein